MSDFINKELILFSYADNVRSIPSVADGLKPGQRKVSWGCFRRKLKSEIKVRITLQLTVSNDNAEPYGNGRSRSSSVTSPKRQRTTTVNRA